MRIILYMGKGGVGKTSVAAATALRAAKLGYKTVVMSTDIAHSLGDCFDTPLGADPMPVTDNLWGHEIDVYREIEVHWSSVQNWLTALMRWRGSDEVMAEETAVLPGMEELMGLLYIARYQDESDYDLLIVDCAPTGETLRLLSFPETARWYMHRLFPIERRVAGAVGFIARGMLRIPVPERKVFDTVQDLYQSLERMNAILENPEATSVRLVVNPEKMVIKEAQRTFTYLNLYGYATDMVICNRVIPDHVQSDYFQAWKESQARYMKLIEEGFTPIPTRTAPLLDREVVGLEALRELGQALYGEDDPTRIYYQGVSQEIAKEGKRHVMRVHLPFLQDSNPGVIQNGDEVVIQAGPYRRTVVLPRSIAGLAVEQATMEGDTLKLVFEGREPSRPSNKGRR